jgi:hypothetical protein
MKKSGLIILGVAVLVTTAPAAAKVKERTGDRIGLFSGAPLDFPANTAFHIAHGWGVAGEREAPPAPIGKFEFQLDVDGETRQADFVEREVTGTGQGPSRHLLLWVFNFPDGMSGAHTLTGHWFTPCNVAVEVYGHPGPCDSPAESVEVLTNSRVITFIEP